MPARSGDGTPWLLLTADPDWAAVGRMAEVDVQQWRLLGPGAELASARKVTLRNEVIDSSVSYGERDVRVWTTRP